jgi:hypothetical protein
MIKRPQLTFALPKELRRRLEWILNLAGLNTLLAANSDQVRSRL